MNRRSHGNGFTLIELIVVVVILGILAATALPKFVNLKSEARIAKMQGFAGALNSGVNLAVAKWQAAGAPATGIDVNGHTILFSNGYPSAGTVYWLIPSAPYVPDQYVYASRGSGATSFCNVDSPGGNVACDSPPAKGTPFYEEDRADYANCAFIYYEPIAAGAAYSIDTANLTATYCK